MFCPKCGAQSADNVNFCFKCGTSLEPYKSSANSQAVNSVPNYNTQSDSQYNAQNTASWQGVCQDGFSNVFYSSAFKKGIKKSGMYTLGCAFIIIPAPLIGFTIYGLISDEMELKTALAIGGFASLVFLIINLLALIKKKLKRQWDGTVINQEEKEVKIKENDSDGYSSIRYETRFFTYIKKDNGRIHKIEEIAINKPSWNYLKPGDRVRFHPELMYPFEKYHKASDGYVLCSFCGRKVSLSEDLCSKCKLPILK